MDRPRKRLSMLRSYARGAPDAVTLHPRLDKLMMTAGKWEDVYRQITGCKMLNEREKTLFTHDLWVRLHAPEASSGALVPDDRLDRCVICFESQSGPYRSTDGAPLMAFSVLFCPWCCAGFHRHCVHEWFAVSDSRRCPHCKQYVERW